mmetsp:Transcript_88259/g.263181  ORF Transcript_88259/g.263181 Transcript_88259/m.263181 type:complete len:154 (-) Transcript_88259:99-560(-)
MPAGGKRLVLPSSQAAKAQQEAAAAKPAAGADQRKKPSGTAAATLLEQRKASRKQQQPERRQSEAEARARNKAFAKRYAEEKLLAAFGPSRDGVPKRGRRAAALAEAEQEEARELAPTRRRVSREEENLQRLSAPAPAKLLELQSKALQNLGR